MRPRKLARPSQTQDASGTTSNSVSARLTNLLSDVPHMFSDVGGVCVAEGEDLDNEPGSCVNVFATFTKNRANTVAPFPRLQED
jgi:hypothetical protein